jgi:polysaccharide export outer membrane protein
MKKLGLTVIALCLPVVHPGPVVAAQAQKTEAPQKAERPVAAAASVPPGYVIGVDDLLSVRFWGDAKFSADVVVRPDGKISLELIGDVSAIGLTPYELADAVKKAGSKFVSEPDVTVIVRDVRSRRVYVIGQVARPGAVMMNDPLTVLQLLATVGGVLEYADKDAIFILRQENGRERRYRFNYNEVLRGKRPEQNILLQPGDTVVVN